jgi:hypothetical protein
LIGHRKLHFDLGVAPAEFGETGFDALPRGFRRHALARRAGAGEQGFDLAQLLAQLRLGRHRGLVRRFELG